MMTMACSSYASSDPFATPTSSLILADLLTSPPSTPRPQRRRIDCLNLEGEATTCTASSEAGFQLSPPSHFPALPHSLFLPPLNDEMDERRDEHGCDLQPGRSFGDFTLKRRRRSLGRAGRSNRSPPSVRPLDDPLDSQKVLEDDDVNTMKVAPSSTSPSRRALPFLDPSWSNTINPTNCKADPSRGESNDDLDEEELAIQAAAAALSLHHRGSSRSSFKSSLPFRPSGSSSRASLENNLFRLRDRS